MTIVASVIARDDVQADGRRQIREAHTDDGGTVHEVSYLAEAASDVEARLSASARRIEARLVQEAEEARREAVRNTAQLKFRTWIAGVDLKTATDMTTEEIELVREQFDG